MLRHLPKWGQPQRSGSRLSPPPKSNTPNGLCVCVEPAPQNRMDEGVGGRGAQVRNRLWELPHPLLCATVQHHREFLQASRPPPPPHTPPTLYNRCYVLRSPCKCIRSLCFSKIAVQGQEIRGSMLCRRPSQHRVLCSVESPRCDNSWRFSLDSRDPSGDILRSCATPKFRAGSGVRHEAPSSCHRQRRGHRRDRAAVARPRTGIPRTSRARPWPHGRRERDRPGGALDCLPTQFPF